MQAVHFWKLLAINNLIAQYNNPDDLKAQHNRCVNSILHYNYYIYVTYMFQTREWSYFRLML